MKNLIAIIITSAAAGTVAVTALFLFAMGMIYSDIATMTTAVHQEKNGSHLAAVTMMEMAIMMETAEETTAMITVEAHIQAELKFAMEKMTTATEKLMRIVFVPVT